MKYSKAKGFSLIEIVFVMVLLAIMLSIVVVTYPGLVNRMQVRADRASASYIIKALRVWYTDNMYDDSNSDEFKVFVAENMVDKRVTLKSLENKGVGRFVDPNYKPNSLRNSQNNIVDNQTFYVGILGTGKDAKFVITIETPETRITENITIESLVDYDGSDVGIICIES